MTTSPSPTDRATRVRGPAWMVFAVTMAPIAAIWVYATWIEPRPFWGYFYDPEGIYFFEGLRLLTGHAPLNVDNPGTPVQFLSAVAALFTDRSPAAFDTVRQAGYTIAFGLAAVAVLVFQRTVLRGLPTFAVIASCWLVFAAPQALQRFHIWSPEALVPAVGLFALAALWRALERPDSSRRAMLAGLAVGLCCSVKFTFAGWAPAAIAAVIVATPRGAGRLRNALQVGGGVAAGFVLGTLPAVTRLPDMFLRLVTVSDTEGRGPSGGFAAILHMMGSSRAWHAGLALLLLGTGLTLWRRRRTREDADPVTRGAIVFASVALIAGYAMSSRSPNLRYLLPTSTAALLLLVVCVRTYADTWIGRWLAPTCVMLLFARAVVVDVPGHHALVADTRLDRDALAVAIERLAPPGQPPVVVYGGRAPHPAIALLMFAQTDEQRAAIGAEYPLAGLYRSGSRAPVIPGTTRPWDLVALDAHELADFPDATGDVLAVIPSERKDAPPLLIAGRP